MRSAWAFAVVTIAACNTRGTTEDTELTRTQCTEITRRLNRFASEDTGGLGTALKASERADVESCLKTGTERAYRCVMLAQSAQDVKACDRHFH